MAISGVTDYANTYAGYTNTAKKAESNVTTSTVEMKTSTPGVTRTEQNKTGYSNVNDYSKYLQSKYSYMNTGTTSMQGVPTTVLVSSAFLKKCMNDPEKAKYLEENLTALPDCASYAVSHTRGHSGTPCDGRISLMWRTPCRWGRIPRAATLCRMNLNTP